MKNVNNKEQFHKLLNDNIGIIQKICRAYSNSEEEFKDYVQEVSYYLWKSIDTFKGESKVSTWVYRVTLNVCLTQLNKNKKISEKLIVNDQIEQNFVHIQAPSEDLQITMLYDAIKQLKEIDKAIVMLYLEKKELKEIANIMGMTISNVGVRINRLKKELKRIING